MPVDPMTSPEQAEAEADERQDEARREQHYAEAERAARAMTADFDMSRNTDIRISGGAMRAVYMLIAIVDHRLYPNAVGARVLTDFGADYGTPALLRVIANVLEAK